MLMAFAAFLLSIQLLNYQICPVHSMTMFYPFWMMGIQTWSSVLFGMAQAPNSPALQCQPSATPKKIRLPSGKLSHNYGKSQFFMWGVGVGSEETTQQSGELASITSQHQ